MKNKLTKTRFNSALVIAGHLFGTVASLGAVMLMCSSAAAQHLYVSARDYSGGKVLRFTWDGLRSTFASGLGAPDPSLEFNYLAFQPVHEIPNDRR
jgi:hypothetical protein